MSQYGTDKPILDARLHGAGLYTADANSVTSHYYNFTFDCKFNGIEIITDENVKLGDNITLITEYNAGPYGHKRYKKFGKDWYLKKDDKTRIILFPTEPKAGIRLHIKYNNTSQNAVTFAVNLFTFVDQQVVDPNTLQEGDDW